MDKERQRGSLGCTFHGIVSYAGRKIIMKLRCISSQVPWLCPALSLIHCTWAAAGIAFQRCSLKLTTAQVARIFINMYYLLVSCGLCRMVAVSPEHFNILLDIFLISFRTVIMYAKYSFISMTYRLILSRLNVACLISILQVFCKGFLRALSLSSFHVTQSWHFWKLPFEMARYSFFYDLQMPANDYCKTLIS